MQSKLRARREYPRRELAHGPSLRLIGDGALRGFERFTPSFLFHPHMREHLVRRSLDRVLRRIIRALHRLLRRVIGRVDVVPPQRIEGDVGPELGDAPAIEVMFALEQVVDGGAELLLTPEDQRAVRHAALHADVAGEMHLIGEITRFPEVRQRERDVVLAQEQSVKADDIVGAQRDLARDLDVRKTTAILSALQKPDAKQHCGALGDALVEVARAQTELLFQQRHAARGVAVVELVRAREVVELQADRVGIAAAPRRGERFLRQPHAFIEVRLGATVGHHAREAEGVGAHHIVIRRFGEREERRGNALRLFIFTTVDEAVATPAQTARERLVEQLGMSDHQRDRLVVALRCGDGIDERFFFVLKRCNAPAITGAQHAEDGMLDVDDFSSVDRIEFRQAGSGAHLGMIAGSAHVIDVEEREPHTTNAVDVAEVGDLHAVVDERFRGDDISPGHQLVEPPRHVRRLLGTQSWRGIQRDHRDEQDTKRHFHLHRRPRPRLRRVGNAIEME